MRGRVQGVGYRYFVEQAAARTGVSGYVRNLDDGRVEVYAVGSGDQLAALAGELWKGPRWAEVRGVEEADAPEEDCRGFRIRS